ncbi:hypothetical protein AK812_SmicGene37425 [Symbiodinium microadriaticum]|uniref:Uncharacterized protein n=1 Tax=Symbiodinium microadriaticum TaxID=2951 RepID=A0A1Q9CGJ8_SYMMI|nr:hypothetical protein AK812_SmicGene37425 [Symbiodinium microadriaticum]
MGEGGIPTAAAWETITAELERFTSRTGSSLEEFALQRARKVLEQLRYQTTSDPTDANAKAAAALRTEVAMEHKRHQVLQERIDEAMRQARAAEETRAALEFELAEGQGTVTGQSEGRKAERIGPAVVPLSPLLKRSSQTCAVTCNLFTGWGPGIKQDRSPCFQITEERRGPQRGFKFGQGGYINRILDLSILDRGEMFDPSKGYRKMFPKMLFNLGGMSMDIEVPWLVRKGSAYFTYPRPALPGKSSDTPGASQVPHHVEEAQDTKANSYLWKNAGETEYMVQPQKRCSPNNELSQVKGEKGNNPLQHKLAPGTPDSLAKDKQNAGYELFL